MLKCISKRLSDLIDNSLAIGCLVLLAFVEPILALADEPKSLRVLSYNIHHARGMDNRVDLERIAKVVVDCKADLVALQEVDHKTRRTSGIDQTAELVKLTGLNGRFAKAIDFEGGAYGQALLTRWPISKLEIEFLPGEPGGEQRIIAIGKLDFAGKPLRFCSTHLHHADANMRLLQAQAINKKFAGEDNTLTIVAGDLNAVPGSAPMVELLKTWTEAKSISPLKTSPSTNPKVQIDYVLYRPESALKLVSVEVINEAIASDHRPVLAMLQLVE
jgi:endonuclease/exonuclease/phosphatase family metal-dependent hydrolase